MNHSGSISSPETWTIGDSPHIITGDIFLTSVLTIDPGCEVKGDAGYGIYVRTGGKILAEGTYDNLIEFKANSTYWDGIFYPESASYTPASDGHFEYCQFEDIAVSNYAIRLELLAGEYFSVDSCIFIGDVSIDSRAIGNNGGTINSNHCIFDSYKVVAVNHTQGTTLVKNSILLNNVLYAFYRNAGTFTSQYNNFYNNGTDYGGTILDKTGDELARDPVFVGGAPYNYHLDSGSPCIGDGESSSDMGLEDYQAVIEVLNDIINDFRTLKNFVFNDINNDFRMQSNIVRTDINNDFRMSGAGLEDIDNDFRMKGIIVRTDINNNFQTRLEVLSDINNRFNTAKAVVNDINNHFAMLEEEATDIWNEFRMTKAKIYDINNEFRTRKESRNDINNDFRMVASWQIAGSAGRESLGRKYVKVYINDVDQTDVDLDSVTWTENVNAPATARFTLGRAFDASKPANKSVVKIKYNNILMYKGYITEIVPGDKPESIQINCQDEMWNLNNTKKYFLVGHKPKDVDEYYFTTIAEALTDLGLNYNVGDFIPQPMDLFGRGEADCITELIENSGNFGWFIKPDGSYRIWKAGSGGVVNAAYQAIGTQVGLYQVLKHSFKESILGLVNRFRVLMGNWTIRKVASDGSGTGKHRYSRIRRHYVDVIAYPDWQAGLGVVSSRSSDGYGWDWHNPAISEKEYQKVFTHYYFNFTEEDVTKANWADTYPPRVIAYCSSPIPGYGQRDREETEGFSIVYPEIYIDPLDRALGRQYKRGKIIFSSPQYTYNEDSKGHIVSLQGSRVRLILVKELIETYMAGGAAVNPDDEPTEDSEDAPYMFYTDKLGDYAETITNALSLPNLSIQEGYSYYPSDATEPEIVPSWDDREFAEDYADWQLSKNADVKTTGSIDLTIDAMLYYRIDLSRRIKINGVVDPINIQSITYNVNSFIAKVNLESKRYYKRSINLPYHGE